MPPSRPSAPSAPSAPGAPDLLEPLLALLAQYVSAPTARSIVGMARSRARVTDGPLNRVKLRDMLESIESNLRLFVHSRFKADECCIGLRALARARSDEPGTAVVVRMRSEDDIATARLAARDFATKVGFTPSGQTRLVTAVSEVARNIVQYAGEGQIELRAATHPAGVEVLAIDRGPGIANIEKIMSGDYKSRLGMGLGLRGVKKIADRFDVQTAVGRGTTVSFVMGAR